MNKKIYPYLFCFFILGSCGINQHEKELLGKWYCVENDGLTRMEFYPDSLIFRELYSQNVEWTANDSIFEFDYTYRHPFTINKTETKISNYRLSKAKDSLFCEVQIPVGINKFTFLRAKSYIDFLSKKNGVKLNLPIDLQVEHIELDSEYGFKIYIKKDNDTLIGLTELGNSMDSLNSDLMEFVKKFAQKDQFHLDKLKHETHFRIFADNSISDKQIMDFLQKVNNTEIGKGYRIYASKEIQNLGYLRGKPIKTIANNGYNSLLLGG